MAGPMLQVEGLVRRFGGLVASNGLDLTVQRGELHALIGPNGAGKTTLISQLQGSLRPNSGRIMFDGRDVTTLPQHARALSGIARSFQISSVFLAFTVLQNVAFAVQAQQGHSFRFWKPTTTDPALIGPAREALQTIGLVGRDHVPASDLSHGERRRLELAMTLALRPKLLLLDEPTAGMGRAEGHRMTEMIAGLKAHYTILLVEHDMDAVFALADQISVLVAGRRIATGSSATIKADPAVRDAYLGQGHRRAARSPFA